LKDRMPEVLISGESIAGLHGMETAKNAIAVPD
jgi:hypothetical protein